MPRKPQILSDRCVYHVTARSNNKEWFYLPIEQVWYHMLVVLEEISISYASRTIAFVLMSNHFHMLLETPLANLDRIMNYFMREVSRAIGKEAGRINHIFGGRYKSTLIHDPAHFANAYKYLYRNPVSANMVERVEDYPFSTLPSIRGLDPYFFPVYDLDSQLSGRIPRSLEERLTWLNTPFSTKENLLIKNALRRVEFSFSKDRGCKSAVAQLME